MPIFAAPIIYAASLVPIIIILISILSYVENKYFGFLFGLAGIVEVIIVIATFGTLILWLANDIISGLEKLHKPSISDHVRQSIIFYLIVLLTLLNFFSKGYNGGLHEGMLLISLLISGWAIILNAIFLYRRRRKANIS